MESSVIITIISTAAAAIIAHFVAVGNLKEKIHKAEIEIEKLRSKQELQKMIIDQFKEQVLNHLPDLFKALNNKRNDK